MPNRLSKAFKINDNGWATTPKNVSQPCQLFQLKNSFCRIQCRFETSTTVVTEKKSIFIVSTTYFKSSRGSLLNHLQPFKSTAINVIYGYDTFACTSVAYKIIIQYRNICTLHIFCKCVLFRRSRSAFLVHSIVVCRWHCNDAISISLHKSHTL